MAGITVGDEEVEAKEGDGTNSLILSHLGRTSRCAYPEVSLTRLSQCFRR